MTDVSVLSGGWLVLLDCNPASCWIRIKDDAILFPVCDRILFPFPFYLCFSVFSKTTLKIIDKLYGFRGAFPHPIARPPQLSHLSNTTTTYITSGSEGMLLPGIFTSKILHLQILQIYMTLLGQNPALNPFDYHLFNIIIYPYITRW